MKIFIKYKQGGYNRDLRFLDTDLMYYFNGHVYKSIHNWLEIFKCMRDNNPIIVLSKGVGSSPDGSVIHENIEFVINPSSIAMVFPVEYGKSVKEKTEDEELPNFNLYCAAHSVGYGECENCKKPEKKDFWLCKTCGAQLPDCTCPPSNDYIGSTNRDGITS